MKYQPHMVTTKGGKSPLVSRLKPISVDSSSSFEVRKGEKAVEMNASLLAVLLVLGLVHGSPGDADAACNAPDAMEKLCNILGSMGLEGKPGARPNLSGVLSLTPAAFGLSTLCSDACGLPCTEMLDYAGTKPTSFRLLCGKGLPGASMRNILRFRAPK